MPSHPPPTHTRAGAVTYPAQKRRGTGWDLLVQGLAVPSVVSVLCSAYKILGDRLEKEVVLVGNGIDS